MQDPRSSDLSRLFRSPFTASRPSSHWLPRDPHCAWQSVRPSIGLSIKPDANIPPPCSALYGRFITLPLRHGFGYNPDIPYIILSLQGNSPRVPPHPGIRPASYDKFVHPDTIYYDGSQGPYEARKYPQEIDPLRPWVVFHEFPQTGSHRPVEYWDVGDFFDFSSVVKLGFSGGQWSIGDIEKLLHRREEVEAHVLDVIQRTTNGIDALRRDFGPSLPFLDELELDHARRWKSWMDGRDALGRTLRYVAELTAFAHWLREVHRQATDSAPSTQDKGAYMGGWVGGITSQSTWLFMSRAPVSLYVLFGISTGHPLYRTAQNASKGQYLDADEQFRSDSFASRLSDPQLRFSSYVQQCRPHTGIIYPNHEPISRLIVVVFSHLTQVLPPGDRAVVNSDRTSHSLPWTSYLFMDPRIFRPTSDHYTQFCLSSAGKALQVYWRQVVGSTTFIPPPTIPEGPSPYLKVHPIVAVLPKRLPTDRKKRTFYEENEGCCFWPTHVGRTSAKDRKAFDLGNNDFLISDYEWPTIDAVIPPIDPIHESYPIVDPNRPPRLYLRREPTPKQKEKMPAILFDLEPPRITRRQTSTRPGTTRTTETVVPVPRTCDSDDEDTTLDDLFGGIAPQSSGHLSTAIPSKPVPCTFSTERVTAIHDVGPSNRNLDPVPGPSTRPNHRSSQHSKGCDRGLNGPGRQREMSPVQRRLTRPDERTGKSRSSLRRPRSSRSRSPQPRSERPSRPRQRSPPVAGDPLHPESPKHPTRGLSPMSQPLRAAPDCPASQVPADDVSTMDVPDNNGLLQQIPPQYISMDVDTIDTTLNTRTPSGIVVPLVTIPALPSIFQEPSTSLVAPGVGTPTPSGENARDPMPDMDLCANAAPPSSNPSSRPLHAVQSSSSALALSPDHVTPIPAPLAQSLLRTSATVQSTSLLSTTQHSNSQSSPDPTALSPKEPSPPAQALVSTMRSYPRSSSVPPPVRQSSPLTGVALTSATVSNLTTTWNEHHLVEIREGWLRAEAYVVHRLNLSNAPANQCSRLVGAHLHHSKLSLHVVCYPLRFQNVFLPEQSPHDMIRAFLDMMLDFGDIVLILMHQEADGSSTFDTGFRFADQAFCAWQRDGLSHGGHYWRISPISSICGHCCMVHPPSAPLRPKSERINALTTTLQLELRIQACNVTDTVSGVDVEQVQQVLHELQTLELDKWSIKSAGTYPNLGENPNVSFIELKPPAETPDWTISPPASNMLAWMQFWTLPELNIPLPVNMTGSAGRRARKLARAPAPLTGVDPASLRLDAPMGSYELHLAYRATHRAASRKQKLWHSPGNDIQLPAVPEMAKSIKGNRRDSNVAYMSIWDWYEECLAVVELAYAASGLGSSHTSPSLGDLLKISTARQRIDTVCHISYNALRMALSPSERLRGLYGEAYMTVMRNVSSL